ncbi:MAG: hypothetical protein HBSAPP03_22710 [Phycisphaerae bacterium]|nr:MAG: hypothetical protein HBSAPP03_22710 [Phycisphaerae bacterium]
MSTPIDHLPPEHDSPIDRYLDGLMSPAERQAFEARLAEDASLREHLDLQRSIDQSLRNVFTYRAPAAASRSFSFRRVGLVAAIAAGLVLALSLVYVLNQPDPFKHRPAADVYAAYVAQGWKPAWACESDQQSADAVSTFLRLPGRAVIVPLATPGVEVLGWIPTDDYRTGTPISPVTLSLLTRVEGRPVLLLVDRVENDRAVTVPVASGLHVYRRVVDEVVIYEISPFDGPRVLPHATPAVPTPKKPRGGRPRSAG